MKRVMLIMAIKSMARSGGCAGKQLRLRAGEVVCAANELRAVKNYITA